MHNKIIIILSTYNGERYLKEQLDSLYNQTYQNFKIIVRDDGSTDTTLEILKAYNLEIMPSNENLGAKGNFNALLEYALQKEDSDYFMFCDQDDVWMEDKIEKTLKLMKEIEYKDKAVLIHTDLSVVDESLNIIDNSFWDYQKLNPNYKLLSNLLIQNNITGCTMMINRSLVKLSFPIPDSAIMHDWWLGLVASEFGVIEYIDEPIILYRQHENNDTGAKKHNFSYMKKNFFKLIKKDMELHKYHRQASSFLDIYKDMLSAEKMVMLNDFIHIEDKSKFKRIYTLWKYKFIKQGFFRNIGLFLRI
jgi:glycosyltransferase involved in cell wall biosynthesis